MHGARASQSALWTQTRPSEKRDALHDPDGTSLPVTMDDPDGTALHVPDGTALHDPDDPDDPDGSMDQGIAIGSSDAAPP